MAPNHRSNRGESRLPDKGRRDHRGNHTHLGSGSCRGEGVWRVMQGTGALPIGVLAAGTRNGVPIIILLRRLPIRDRPVLRRVVGVVDIWGNMSLVHMIVVDMTLV